MPTFEELDELSSKDLHDRAVKLAEKRLDVAFFWRLVKEIPAAEAGAGAEREAEADVAFMSHQVHKAMHADEGGLADALRPVYIEYLLEHDHD